MRAPTIELCESIQNFVKLLCAWRSVSELCATIISCIFPMIYNYFQWADNLNLIRSSLNVLTKPPKSTLFWYILTSSNLKKLFIPNNVLYNRINNLCRYSWLGCLSYAVSLAEMMNRSANLNNSASTRIVAQFCCLCSLFCILFL